MRIIISDTNALIDLRKAALLEALLSLPYSVQVPDLLYEDELLSFPDQEKHELKKQGLEVVSMASPLIARALEFVRSNPALRLYDCAAMALAEETSDCILLTGDGRLRAVAQNQTIEVRGVLWAFDEILQHRAATIPCLRAALTVWTDDSTVWLPDNEIQARLRSLLKLK